VENWQQSAKGQNQFNHRCDTEPGSSGAAIISTSSLSIVGVHNGGGDGWNYASFFAPYTSIPGILGARDAML
jgi:V8-like Glu-specific endopeptidase